VLPEESVRLDVMVGVEGFQPLEHGIQPRLRVGDVLGDRAQLLAQDQDLVLDHLGRAVAVGDVAREDLADARGRPAPPSARLPRGRGRCVRRCYPTGHHDRLRRLHSCRW